MYKRLITSALVFGMAAIGPPAEAQPLCGERDAVIARLSELFDEKQSALGLRSVRDIMEIWTNEELGTWTVLMTRADGTTCIVAAGTNWMSNFPNSEGLSKPMY